jgi:hypothetical protein
VKQHGSNVDDRIHAFIAGKTSKSLSNSVADWFQVKFGARDSEVQAGETVVGIKYEPASRGKF